MEAVPPVLRARHPRTASGASEPGVERSGRSPRSGASRPSRCIVRVSGLPARRVTVATARRLQHAVPLARPLPGERRCGSIGLTSTSPRRTAGDRLELGHSVGRGERASRPSGRHPAGFDRVRFGGERTRRQTRSAVPGAPDGALSRPALGHSRSLRPPGRPRGQGSRSTTPKRSSTGRAGRSPSPSQASRRSCSSGFATVTSPSASDQVRVGDRLEVRPQLGRGRNRASPASTSYLASAVAMSAGASTETGHDQRGRAVATSNSLPGSRRRLPAGAYVVAGR